MSRTDPSNGAAPAAPAMRTDVMLRLVTGIAAALLLGAAPAATVDDLGWMAGVWIEEAIEGAGGRWTEEYWTLPRGGVMLGASRSGREGNLREFEFLRLQAGPDGGVSYLAQPGGGAPVAFRLVRHDAASAIFENPAHDYPQRIVYTREGDTLTATISLIDGSKARRWVYRRR